jgi:hypothetical protein
MESFNILMCFGIIDNYFLPPARFLHPISINGGFYMVFWTTTDHPDDRERRWSGGGNDIDDIMLRVVPLALVQPIDDNEQFLFTIWAGQGLDDELSELCLSREGRDQPQPALPHAHGIADPGRKVDMQWR